MPSKRKILSILPKKKLKIQKKAGVIQKKQPVVNNIQQAVCTHHGNRKLSISSQISSR